MNVLARRRDELGRDGAGHTGVAAALSWRAFVEFYFVGSNPTAAVRRHALPLGPDSGTLKTSPLKYGTQNCIAADRGMIACIAAIAEEGP